MKPLRFAEHDGFTLVELLISVAVVSILLAVALPNYTEYLSRGRRIDATAGLMNLTNRMERYYAINNTYLGATIGTGNTGTDILGSASTPGGQYVLSIYEQTEFSYTLRATRAQGGAQASDACGDYTLKSTNARGNINGSPYAARCW